MKKAKKLLYITLSALLLTSCGEKSEEEKAADCLKYEYSIETSLV